jgi:hypothetical protein
VATQYCVEGQATLASWLTGAGLVPLVTASDGKGGALGVTVPLAIDSTNEVRLPAASSYSPTAMQDPAAGHDTLSRPPADVGPASGNGASVALQAPPDWVRMRPWK